MGRPIIGITGELEAARWRNWIREAVLSPVSYTRAVERAGGTPVILPPVPSSSVPSLVAKIDALVVAGGRDVDPSLYNETPHDQTDVPDHRRDRFEILMTRAAIEADLPFLAICRGMHILNVARGGTLIQHLPDRLGSESHKPDPVKMTIHDVEISAASNLGRVLGTTAQVPAAHHQGIDRIGSGLLTVAWTPDQVVEAVELQGHRFGIGVQWHPEEGDDTRIFEALVAAAKPATAPAPAAEVTGRSKRSSKRHATRSLPQRQPPGTAIGEPAAPRSGLRSAGLRVQPGSGPRPTGQAGPHGRGVPFQPRRRRTAAISAAVRQRFSVVSGQPYLRVSVPWTRFALSRRVSRQRPSAGWAASPSSSTHRSYSSYRLSRYLVPLPCLRLACRLAAGRPWARSTP